MGYESKLYIGRRSNFFKFPDEKAYFETIVTYELCKMGYADYNGKSFYDIFDKEIDFDLYIDGEYTNLDCYGEKCTYASIPDVLEWLEVFYKNDDYWRVKPLIEMLKSFANITNTENIIVVHYGH